jgi:hypothetical protein
MNCHETCECITDASEGALTGWRWLMYRFHIGICVHCKAHRRQLEKTIATLASVPKEAPSYAASDAALAAFRKYSV